jgi:hypothetical protein
LNSRIFCLRAGALLGIDSVGDKGYQLGADYTGELEGAGEGHDGADDPNMIAD